jgi:hypothetical protein
MTQSALRQETQLKGWNVFNDIDRIMITLVID